MDRRDVVAFDEPVQDAFEGAAREQRRDPEGLGLPRLVRAVQELGGRHGPDQHLERPLDLPEPPRDQLGQLQVDVRQHRGDVGRLPNPRVPAVHEHHGLVLHVDQQREQELRLGVHEVDVRVPAPAVEVERPAVLLGHLQGAADQEVADGLGVLAGLAPLVRAPPREGLAGLGLARVPDVQARAVGDDRLEGDAVRVRRGLRRLVVDRRPRGRRRSPPGASGSRARGARRDGPSRRSMPRTPAP